MFDFIKDFVDKHIYDDDCWENGISSLDDALAAELRKKYSDNNHDITLFSYCIDDNDFDADTVAETMLSFAKTVGVVDYAVVMDSDCDSCWIAIKHKKVKNG